MRRTKIIATLGPSSIDKIEQMLDYVDIFRINFAHGDEKSHKLYFDLIREKKKDMPILVDLPGPKIRIGDIEKEIFLRQGDRIIFSQKGGIPVEDPNFYNIVKKNSEILVADGNIKIRIINKGEGFAEGIVIEGGILRSRKGLNIPKLDLNSGLTENDFVLLEEALKLGADFIGVSFVLSENDIIKVKEKVKGNAWVIAKIEKDKALKNLEAIIRESDGVMVARGDLGLEIGLEKLPFVQKEIIEAARFAGKPVILATQVLNSMINNPIPTRAEVTDIANAINEGVDAILLTDETAEGKYPVEAVKYLDRIITYAEKKVKKNRAPARNDIDDAIALATVEISEIAKTKLIFIHSRSGNSIMRVSRFRPKAIIIGLCNSEKIAKKINLCYGVKPIVLKKEMKDINEIISFCEEFYKEKISKKGRFVVAGGDPKSKEGKTDFIKLHEVNFLE